MAPYGRLLVAGRKASLARPFVRRDGRRTLTQPGVWLGTTIAADSVSLAIALTIGFAVTGIERAGALPVVALAILFGLAYALGLYDRRRLPDGLRVEDAPAIALVATVLAASLEVLSGSVIGGPLSAAALGLIWICVVAGMGAGRHLAGRTAIRVAPAGRCAVLGEPGAAQSVADEISTRGLAVVTSVLVPGEDGSQKAQVATVRRLVAERAIEWIVIAPGSCAGDLTGIARCFENLPVEVSVLPRRLVGTRGSRSSRFAKRVLDLVVAGTALILVAPLLATIALAVKLDTGGAAFYVQRRVGRNGRSFPMLKFRTMVVGAHQRRADLRHLNPSRGGLFKLREDPRVTRVGRWLRASCLDQLPQLVNVMRGEMSLVGPRPLLVEEDCRIEDRHRHRNAVSPGMTGHWQLLGFPRATLDEMLELDHVYANSWSVGVDVKLLARTIPYVARCRGT